MLDMHLLVVALIGLSGLLDYIKETTGGAAFVGRPWSPAFGGPHGQTVGASTMSGVAGYIYLIKCPK
jgi:hypothetical protein